MIIPARKFMKCPTAFLLVGAVCLLMTSWPDTADARGGRGGGGGFSRSSPASGGSFSGGVATQPRAASSAGDIGQARTARNAGDVGQPRTAGSVGGAGQPGTSGSVVGVQSAGGAQTTGGAGQARTAGNSEVTPQQMAAYRQQFASQNQGRDNWDQVDPDYSVRAPVAPAAVVGAAAAVAVARDRADDYVGFVNTVDDPQYLTEDSCSIEAITSVDNVTYYRCSNAWYTRGYEGGNVVYIPTNPPAGY
jgi:hypothetical protein